MHVDQAYATAAVLLVMVILLNLISSKISARIARQTKETR
jgi:ABC-type phosphate transport system permease subunit